MQILANFIYKLSQGTLAHGAVGLVDLPVSSAGEWFLFV